MDILCSDKTGTTTQNSISIGDIELFPGCSEEILLQTTALASLRSNYRSHRDRVFSRMENLYPSSDASQMVIEDFIPFDQISKYSNATIRDSSGKPFVAAKGASQAITSLADLQGHALSRLNDWVTGLAEKGFRSLGVAKTDLSGTWEYLGLL